ncbi:NAD-dependent epimerase/dehydratase family protein [Magnetospira sp. QH-2]|uniref:NAD-dependent epimerase/dehydratase family protein n=1 Tax=Magnetospira sp. (strain QH-2) TaxID=1288970 RepID=UPI0003E80A96|nr:NAD-dependent epimerase/dehydratase family protein [Magnetospira sp. QH-2]CCQ75490.1 putative NAD-dependent epimerase/dehydratase [Magnetospira sp. QH-2]
MSSFLLQSDLTEIITNLGQDAHDFSGKTVVLTGARGFLGRYFTEVFKQLNETTLDKPCQVIAMDNMITAGGKVGAVEEEIPNIRFMQHDVIKPVEIDEDVHYVIHTAGIASPFYYNAYPLETVDVATTGTRHMLELAEKNHARFVFMSSSEIYGDPDQKHVPTPESYRGNVTCQGLRACYDESKRLGETLCYIFHEKYGTAANTIRPFNVFGPGMKENDYRVMPNFASRIKGGLPLQVYGTGNQTRTFCYVVDAMTGFLKVVLRGVPGEAYNIGTPTPEVTVLELVERMEQVLGRPIDRNVIEYPDSYPADEPMRRCPDIRKARLQLDFNPSVELNEGLRRYLAWTDETYIGEQ